MKNVLKMKSWSPYVVGAGIGILSWFTFLTAGNPLGISTAFESTAAIAEQQILPQMAATNPFFEKKVPKIDWGWMLVVGVFVGALISSHNLFPFCTKEAKPCLTQPGNSYLVC